MNSLGIRLAGAALSTVSLASFALAEEPVRSVDPSTMPPPKMGDPEDYASPVIERPVFDKLRWTMTMADIEKEYEGRTFWSPQSTVYTKCLKWQEPILDQMHFINVCGDETGYPVSISVTSEDVLSREWIQMVGDRYDVTIPFETKGFKEARTVEFPPYPTLFRMTYENFLDNGQRRQRLAMAFVNQLRNDKLMKSPKASPRTVSTPVPAPIEKAKAAGQ